MWKLFGQFYIKLDVKPLNWEDRIVLFAAFLIDNKLKSTSVRTYVSAIKSVLVEDNIRVHKDTYLLSSLTRCCKLKNDVVINRFPIRKDLLHLIMNETEKYFSERNQPYLIILYKALFVSAYFGMLRAGEVTKGPHVVLAENIHIGLNKDKILFVLKSSKMHDKGQKLQLIKFSRTTLADLPKDSTKLTTTTKVRAQYCLKHCSFCTFKDFIIV